MAKSTALLTGASSGIGFEMAQIFARNGIDLILVARGAAKLNELKSRLEKEYKITVRVIPADLSKVQSCDTIFAETEKAGVHVDVLVNNAGFGDFGLFERSDWNKDFQMIELNVTTLTRLTKLYLPAMVKAGAGRILNVASTAAFQPGPLMAVYYATKAYVLFFSEAISNELKGTGVTVTALCPGPTISGFQEAASLGDSKLFKTWAVSTSREVAEYGFKAMMNGKTVAIHGLINRILVFSTRLAPRKLLTMIVRRLQESVGGHESARS